MEESGSSENRCFQASANNQRDKIRFFTDFLKQHENKEDFWMRESVSNSPSILAGKKRQDRHFSLALLGLISLTNREF